MNVLGLPPGPHPKSKGELVCNTLPDISPAGSNFLNEKVREAIERTLDERSGGGAGMIEEERLNRNLLSSQPLCFNFFGPLMVDLELANKIIRALWPDVEAVNAVHFEYAPSSVPRPDNSAFDVALEVTIEGQHALLGLECKYTDSFSTTEYDKPEYRALYEGSAFFAAPYEQFKATGFNQLFRGQLLAERLLREGRFRIVRTGLFCHEMDSSAIETGRAFQTMLNRGDLAFRITTYADFISAAQSAPLSWEERQWTMLLWARYSALQMSDAVEHELRVG